MATWGKLQRPRLMNDAVTRGVEGIAFDQSIFGSSFDANAVPSLRAAVPTTGEVVVADDYAKAFVAADIDPLVTRVLEKTIRDSYAGRVTDHNVAVTAECRPAGEGTAVDQHAIRATKG